MIIYAYPCISCPKWDIKLLESSKRNSIRFEVSLDLGWEIFCMKLNLWFISKRFSITIKHVFIN